MYPGQTRLENFGETRSIEELVGHSKPTKHSLDVPEELELDTLKISPESLSLDWKCRLFRKNNYSLRAYSKDNEATARLDQYNK